MSKSITDLSWPADWSLSDWNCLSYDDGDYNRSGIVDTADYTVWRDEVGYVVPPCSGAGQSAGVPEPASVVQPLAATLMLIRFPETVGQAVVTVRVAGKETEVCDEAKYPTVMMVLITLAGCGQVR